jgi:Fe(3+) dicitrate transport protein
MRNYRTSIVATHVMDPSDEVKLTTNVYRHDYYRIWRKVNRFDDAHLFDVLTDPTPIHEEYAQVLRGNVDSLDSQALWIGPNEREFVSQGIESRLRWDAETGPIAHRMEYGLRFHNDRVDRRHSEDQFNIVEGVPRPTLISNVTTFNEDWTYAFAAHAANAMTWRALTVTPGVRFELIRSGAQSFIPDATTDLVPDEQTRWSHAVLPGLGLYYALTEQLGLLGGVYRGFSPPAPGSGSDVDPELSWNYEAGARYSRGASRAELIGFYNDYQNLTTLCTFSMSCADQQLDMQFDAGRARIYGFEAYVDSDIPLSSELKLPVSAAYTLTQTEFLQTFESQNPVWGNVERGDEMPYVPEHQLSASLGLEHKRAGGNVSANYVAAMLERKQPRLETDEQLTFDVALYYRALEALELYAIAHNIFDSDFIVSRRPYGARPNAPLTVMVGVKADL